MNAFLDTSVLIPVFYGDHTHHSASLDVFARCNKDDGSARTAWPSVFRLTRMPGKHRISCEQTMLFIGDIRERLTIIAMDGDSMANIFRKRRRRVSSRARLRRDPRSLKADAEIIYTWNVRHFSRFGRK